MRKIRSDALWLKLTIEQQKKIEHWFFVDCLGYRAVWSRIRTELGVNCAFSVMGRMYHYCRQQRSEEREAVMDRLSQYLVEPGAQLERIPPEALMVVSGRLMHRALQQDNVKSACSLGRLMAKTEENEIACERKDIHQKKLGLEELVLALKAGAISREQFLMALGAKAGETELQRSES